MKLTQVQVRMFRNILDSSEVKIQPNVTCLVGKNESGKTAFLHALQRLNPARVKRTFSIPDHYPAWLEKRHRMEGKELSEVQPIEALFAWEEKDVQAVAAVLGAGVVSVGAPFRLWKTYDNKFGWEHGCNEAKAVENVIASGKDPLPKEASKPFKGTATFERLAEVVAQQLKAQAEAPEAVKAIQKLEARRQALLGSESLSAVVWKTIEPRMPRFFYFADYSKLPYTTRINHVLTAGDDALNDGEVTARALLRLGGAEQEYVLNPNYERRTRELENVANALTDDVLKYWSQNPELRVQPEITQRTEQKPDGQHSVLDEMKVRIWDNRHSLSLPFDQHSAGFQWFFSFLAAFSEYENADPPVVILLDEPAVGLHAKAQADFLRFIEDRLTKKCQVIYTTHSPFMVQPGHLERVRIVEDRGKEEGGTVSIDVLTRDPDTLFPLQGALGYDLAQHLFVGPNNLVVEGTSDYTYFWVISDFLASQAGRTSLDPRWSIVPVGGADAVPTFVALLGHHLDVTVVVDSRRDGQQKLSKMANEGYLSKHRIVLIGDVLGKKLGDVEDLFEPGEYLALYNKAFGASLTETDLQGTDPIVQKIARHLGIERFDHGRPADLLLRERDRILPTISHETLKRFETLFERINKTL